MKLPIHVDYDTRTPKPLGYELSTLVTELNSSNLSLGRSRVYPVGVPNHYTCIFIIFQLWLTSHPRSVVALLDTGTPGISG